MRVFCIDGVVVETDHEPTRDDLRSGALMPIEDQPIMAGVLPRDISLLSPDTAARFIEVYGGAMVEDRNTETFSDVTDAMAAQGRDVGSGEWPQ